MKSIKTTFIRGLSLLLTLVLLLNLPISAFAAVTIPDWNAKYTYQYDAERTEMIDSPIFRALKYLGYDSSNELANNGYLFTPGYSAGSLSNKYEKGQLKNNPFTGIPYANISYGTATTKDAQGNTVPNVANFKSGGLVCNSFIEYYYLNYLKNIEGINIDYLYTAYYDAADRINKGTEKYGIDSWYEMAETLVAEGTHAKAYYFEPEDSVIPSSGSLTEGQQKYLKLFDTLPIGSLIRFGYPGQGKYNDEFKHYAIYAGSADGVHYIIHIANKRGPEISIIENMISEDQSKRSYPLAFYLFKDTVVEENYGSITVYKDDPNGKPLAGATFRVIYPDGSREYITTDSTGYASLDELPLGTYTIQETVSPDGYELDETVYTVKLTEEKPDGGGTIHVTNTPKKGSLKIIKNIAPSSAATSGNLAGWQFDVYKNSPSFTTTIQSGVKYRVKITNGSTGEVLYTDTASLTAQSNPAIKILSQPQSGAVSSGKTITFNVAATSTTGKALTYRWYYQTVENPGTWTATSASTGSSTSYSINMENRLSGRRVKCLISDGTNEVWTNEAFLYVNTMLDDFAIVDNLDSVSGAKGDTVTLHASAQGSNVIYEWQVSTNGGSTWTTATNSAAGTYTTMIRNGVIYRVKVTDVNGKSIYSDTAALTVAENQAIKITSQPKSTAAPDGNGISFHVEAESSSSKALTYRWYYQLAEDVGTDKWTATSASTGSGDTYSLDITKARHGRKVKCLISDGTNQVWSNEAFLYESSSLGSFAIVDNLDAVSGKAGEAVALSVTAQGTGLNYQWEISTDGGNTWTAVNPNYVGTCTTDTTGTIQIDNLTSGSYYVQEVNPGKDGWEYDLIPKVVTVTESNTAANPATVTFENTLNKGTIEVIKVDENGNLLSGAVFKAMDRTGTYYFTESTEQPGHYFLEDLVFGTYTVVEVSPPPGYDLGAQTKWNVTLGKDSPNSTETITVINTESKGDLLIEKLTEDDEYYEGWEFAIYANEDLSILVADKLYTDEDGMIRYEGMTPGTYWVVEVGHRDPAVNALYHCVSENPQEITVKANTTNTVSFENNLNRGSLEITKDTNTGTDRDGWKVNVYFGSVAPENLLPGSPFTTDENGKIVITDLLIGTYIAVEVDDGKEMWIYDLKEKFAEVPANGTGYITITNTQLGYGEIVKDTTNGGTKEGWMFLVKDADGNEIDGSPFTTGADGKIDLGLLLPGDYTVQEIGHSSMTAEQLVYWTQATEPQTLTVVAGTTQSVTFLNQWTGKGQIVKDATNGGIKAGWQFKVWTDAGEIGIFTTDSNGKIDLNNLIPGTYYVQEIGHEAMTADELRYWIMDTEVKELTIVAGQTSSVSFENQWLGELTIKKNVVNGMILSGWTGDLYMIDVSGEEIKIGTYTSDENGNFAELLVAPGKYIFRETGHTDSSVELNYWIMSSDTEITVNAGATASATVTNIQQGYGEIQKDTTNGGTKEGWMFLVKDADGNEIDGSPFTTGAEGKINLGLLLPGNYTVQEIGHSSMTAEQLAYWTQATEPQTLTVFAGTTKAVTFVNQWSGMGTIVKTTVNGGSVAGWQFKVWTDTAEIGIFTTNENGEFNLGLLAPGTYYVQEVGHETYDLRYWFMDSEVKELTIVAGQTATVSFQNVWMGELVINKELVNSELLAGWIGDLYLVNPDGTETKIGTYTSDENGIFAELLVAPGHYIFRETGHTDSTVELKYWVMAEALEMEVSAGSTTSATIINTELGNGQIQKDTTNGGIKEGWQFNVWSDSMETITVTTNENGEYDLGLLAPGIYYVQEIGHISMTAEQLAYWIMDAEVKTLVVEAGAIASVRFENEWLGYGQIKKEMPDGGDLAGWIFDVYRVSDNAYIGEFTSDENGDIALGYLIPGEYRVIERVPNGSLYQPVGGNEKILTVIAGEVSSLTVRNTLKSGEIILNKVDSANDKALAGAKFLLEWLDGDVWKPVILSDTIIPGGCRSEGLVNGCLVTDANGQAIFEGLHPDLEYRLTEVEAPNGYLLQAIPVFEGKLPADTLSKTVKAYNSGISIPETGDASYLNVLIPFTAFVVCLFFVMVALAAKEGMLTEMIRKYKK